MFLKKEEGGGSFLSKAIFAFFVVLIVQWLWPETIPFDTFELWKAKGSLGEAVLSSWPIFLWVFALNFVVLLFKRGEMSSALKPKEVLFLGGVVSIWAGVAEEISFRWLIFYGEIVGYKITNWLFFGWAGFGLMEWIYVHITAPIANFFTLGLLEPLLFNGLGWAVGAAIISSNGKFRDGHLYQGFVGWINSWFLGMFLFHITFSYGLVAAIVVHFLIDMFIFGLVYINAVLSRLGRNENYVRRGF